MGFDKDYIEDNKYMRFLISRIWSQNLQNAEMPKDFRKIH